jgi:uncharacterized membrane protein YeaQ/YmgE (transglycosylase-associated protein family)
MDAVGWIVAIIIGGTLVINVVLGIVGAAIASAILSTFGVVLGGWLGYLIAGFIGACLLIWIARVVKRMRRA